MQSVNKKEEQITGLTRELIGYEAGFDELKETGATIENFRLFDLCIGRMEEMIDTEKEHLKVLQKQEDAKKKEVIEAKVDTSRYEKLKDKKYIEYQKAVAKAEEAFIEEFVSNTAMQIKRQQSG
jgi:flagellar FliJ protein